VRPYIDHAIGHGGEGRAIYLDSRKLAGLPIRILIDAISLQGRIVAEIGGDFLEE
jgi:hypothetical protein